MRAVAWCTVNEGGERVALGHGDIIGRMARADLRIDDARISEAHAMVSLRGGSLVLLALRGRFRVGGKIRTEARLESGVAASFAPDIELRCHGVVLPTRLLGLELDGAAPMLLTNTTTIDGGSPPVMRPGFDPDGELVLWGSGDEWCARPRGGEIRELAPGDEIALSDGVVRIVEVGLMDASRTRTRQTSRPPMTFELLGESVRLCIGTHAPVVISGVPGKILESIVDGGGAMDWKVVASDVWPDDQSLEHSVRKRFDAGLRRLRARLEEIGAPDGVVELDGAGVVVLALSPDDVILARTHAV